MKEMKRNESGEREQERPADSMMKRATGRVREGEKEKDRQIN